MADSIRDIVIRIAIEQKNVVLKTPDFKPMTTAAAQAGQSSADAISKKMDAGIAQVEKDLRKLDAQLDKQEKDAERRYDQEAKAALSAYSRIMRERERNTAAAEKAADQEAKAALQAYSRIMRERDRNAASAQKQYDSELNSAVRAYDQIQQAKLRSSQAAQQADARSAALQSSVLGALGESVEATARLAKGVAFLSAANEEDAAAMVRKIAAYQGYFDIISGGVHVIKSLGDVQRQTALFMTATAASEAAVAAGSVPAAAGLTNVAAAGTAVTVSLGPLTIIAAAAAAAGYLVYQNWKYWSDLAKKDLIPSAEVMTNKFNVMASAAQSSAQAAAAVANARTSGSPNSESARVAAYKELSAAQKKLGSETAIIEFQSRRRQEELETARRNGFGDIEQMLSEEQASQQRLSQLRKDDINLEQQKNELVKAGLQAREKERDQLMQINQAAQQTLAVEENRNRSENVRLGLLTRGQQAQVKQLLDKKASGQELTQTDIRRAQRFGVLNSSVEAFGQKRADESGLTASRNAAGEGDPLRDARRNAESSQKRFSEAANDINKEIDKLNEANKTGVNRIVTAFQLFANDTVSINDLAIAIEKIQRQRATDLQTGRKN